MPLVLDEQKIKKASEKWARDSPELPGLPSKLKKKKRKISAKAQKRHVAELATPPIRPAKKMPEHSPFGFGGDSPRDIKMLIGFRKPLPRDRGPAAIYLHRRRKARAAGGLSPEQLAALEQTHEGDGGGGDESAEEDEFTRQLRQHAERRRRKLALQKEEQADQAPGLQPSGPAPSPQQRTPKRRGRSRRRKNKQQQNADSGENFFDSRASRNPGKMTKSAYRREHMPTRHRREGRELQRLGRLRSEKPSMLFRVLADAHCRKKKKQQA